MQLDLRVVGHFGLTYFLFERPYARVGEFERRTAVFQLLRALGVRGARRLAVCRKLLLHFFGAQLLLRQLAVAVEQFLFELTTVALRVVQLRL